VILKVPVIANFMLTCYILIAISLCRGDIVAQIQHAQKLANKLHPVASMTELTGGHMVTHQNAHEVWIIWSLSSRLCSCSFVLPWKTSPTRLFPHTGGLAELSMEFLTLLHTWSIFEHELTMPHFDLTVPIHLLDVISVHLLLNFLCHCNRSNSASATATATSNGWCPPCCLGHQVLFLKEMHQTGQISPVLFVPCFDSLNKCGGAGEQSTVGTH